MLLMEYMRMHLPLENFKYETLVIRYERLIKVKKFLQEMNKERGKMWTSFVDDFDMTDEKVTETQIGRFFDPIQKTVDKQLGIVNKELAAVSKSLCDIEDGVKIRMKEMIDGVKTVMPSEYVSNEFAVQFIDGKPVIIRTPIERENG